MESDNYVSDDEDVEPPNDTDDLDDHTLQVLGWLRPLAYAFRMLSSIAGLPSVELKEILLTSLLTADKMIYHDIEDYFLKGQCHPFKLQLNKIFRIQRFEDYNHGYPKLNKTLIWHGTKTQNISSILSFGFSRPGKAGCKLMFGDGVYFADRASKSAQYCDSTSVKGSKGYLFLCSVNLGRSYTSDQAENNRSGPPSGFDSVIGRGKLIPDTAQNKYYHGSVLPCGETVSRICEKDLPLRFNEYIVYDMNRIVIKFLVEFEVI